MSHASLAARYRPQTFAEVTGQETVKAILSRAAAEDKVAPAYLLSGTRGVGKTTIARIFAKALNCVHAPTGEPCNQCEQCRRITMGNHVDVVEIDGASNRGIDDARRLREAIAYAPMEGRYKVFIIDEAHMLTRESFNALLKTLEEPPPRATFILATTEAHKFPITIVSRCQHFIFKAIPEAELVAHLTRVLNKEGIPFEENAVRLLARRAAGSVRDSMSLLGQTLALGGDHLTEASTRSVLGLAGQELYERLLNALKAQDCLAVAALTQELLERGVDLGFFLRELTTLWRNLFLIRQAGAAATAALDMPDAEKQRLLDLAPQFDPAYIHAAWQMVLESQRQVLTSLEPSAALELLLLNLALLPRLVSLETLSRTTVAPASGTPAAPTPSAPTAPPAPASPAPASSSPVSSAPVASVRSVPAAPVSSPSAPAAAPVQPKAAQPALTDEELFLRDGADFLNYLKTCQGRLGDQADEELVQMRKTCAAIMGFVHNHPEQLPRVRRYREYYMPTTRKLLNTALGLGESATQNAQEIRRDIVGILHTLNTAYEKLYDTLLQDVSMDVSTEIDTLEAMLNQDGLTHDFAADFGAK